MSNPPSSDSTAGALRFLLADRLFAALPEMGQDLRARPQAEETVIALIARLRGGPTPEEALTLAAYGLSPRHAVWWAHECLMSLREDLPEGERRLLGLAAAWVTDPGPEARNRVLEAAMQVGPGHPAAWVAFAAGWSGGSMAPADQPAVPPPAFLTGRAVNAAVLSTLARIPTLQRRRWLAHFLTMAEALARGP